VIESRDLDDSASIRRRRQCLKCDFRFTTYERQERPHLAIIKKGGSREPFNRDKVASGLYRAFEKRPVSAEDIETLISAIERDVRARGEAEVASKEVGEIVMQKLIDVDDVAYVRFASVYRSFTDVASFERELQRLKSRV
jgi:transcriptional repressor NrdR